MSNSRREIHSHPQPAGLDDWEDRRRALEQRLQGLATFQRERIEPYMQALRDHLEKAQIDLARLNRLQQTLQDARDEAVSQHVSLTTAARLATRKIEQAVQEASRTSSVAER